MAEDKNAALMQAMLAGGMYGPNPYSQFPSGIQSTSYAGTPTDARGIPIQPPPGTTLNSTPAAPAAPPMTNPFAGVQIPQGQNTAVAQPFGGLNREQWNALTPQQRSPAQAAMNEFQAGVAATPSDSFVASHYGGGGGPGMGSYLQGAGYDAFNRMGNQATPAAAPAPTQQPANSYQTALAMLANPGHISTPGANVPASQPITNQPSVLDQFLAGGNQGGTGAGGYSNTGFFDTLNKLKGMSQ